MILRAGWVCPIASAPIRDGFVELRAERIARVGCCAAAATDLQHAAEQRQLLDLGDVALLPGLVNPHTHLELSRFAGRIEPGSLWNWVAQLVRLVRDADLRAEQEREIERSAWEMLRAGVTCAGDVSRRNTSWPVLKRVPIRKVCFVELLALALQPPRTVDELRAAVESVAEDELLTAGISPHAPYSVPIEAAAEALRLATRLERPWAMHVAETPEEVAFLHGTAALPGSTAGGLFQRHAPSPHCEVAEYVRRVAGDARPGALIHMNYLTESDVQAVAGLPHSIVYCPRAHRFFGHAAHPLPALIGAGARVALGTDSLASNDSLSMLDELRFVAGAALSGADPASLMRLVTADAARALGLHDRIGTLEAGKLADIAAFDCPSAADPLAHVLRSAERARAVWVHGRAVLHESGSHVDTVGRQVRWR